MAISEQWAELLEPGLRTIFNLQFSALSDASRIPILFNQMGSEKSAEYFLGVGGMSDWEQYKGTIEYDDPEQGYKTTLTHEEFVKGFKVERKLVDDDLYNIINQRPAGLAMSAMRTREKHAASIFNNAFSATYAGGDSVELCGAHPYSPGNATTQSSAGTTALSYDAVVATRKLMRSYKDDRGELVAINPDLIVHPPELEDTANAIVNTMNSSSTNKPGTTDFEDNFVARQGIQHLNWDYLTDANNWFLVDSQLAKLHLLWLDRIALEFSMDPTSDFNLEAKYRGYMRYSYGWSDWRWAYGHAVA